MVSWNGLDLTREAYEHLLAQTDQDFRLVLWDNASTDGTQEWMQSVDRPDNVHFVLSQENLLWVPAILAAVLVYWEDEEYIAWMNNDMFMPPYGLQRMVQHFKDNSDLGLLAPVGGGLGGGQDFAANEGYWPALIPQGVEPHWHNLKGPLEGRPLTDVNFISGAFAMTTAAIWEELGGLDPALALSCDDMEYSVRMHANGYRVAVAADVYARHISHSTGVSGSKHWDANMEPGYVHFVRKWAWYLRKNPHLMEGVMDPRVYNELVDE